MKTNYWLMLALAITVSFSNARNTDGSDFQVFTFGDGGQLKMIYDRRQRPQAVYINDRVYMVYNGGADKPAGKKKERTYPFVISFNPATRALSEPVKLSDKGSSDQHYCPIIWADKSDFLHILFGCHKTAGTHLISKQQAAIGNSRADWSAGPEIRYSLSYPTVYNIYGNRKVMYFRTGEHRSSWSYLISADEGRNWQAPPADVVDLNMGGDAPIPTKEYMENELSSYQSVLPSKDGTQLHVAFACYDDNKSNIREKFWNPRYGTKVNYGFKYNLYYVKINLQTHAVQNFDGQPVRTPVSMETANEKCMIWDTDWRGAGVPPDIILDKNDHPAFLHVLSEDSPEKFNYYYVRYVDGSWKQTVIAPSNHEWNSCYLRQHDDGALSAYLVTGNNPYDPKSGKMDSRGGGETIEQWRSADGGNSWTKARDLTPRDSEFAGWKFNNIQPVQDTKGNVKDGMLLFYGWKNPDKPRGKAFLIVE